MNLFVKPEIAKELKNKLHSLCGTGSMIHRVTIYVILNPTFRKGLKWGSTFLKEEKGD